MYVLNGQLLRSRVDQVSRVALRQCAEMGEVR
jgi:hypothetical protein